MKKVMWYLGQRTVLEHTHLFHATAHSEVNDIRTRNYKQPIAVIPNGVDIPLTPPEPLSSLDGKRCLLFLSRIHPVKGADVLMHAWQRLEREYNNWELVVAGPLAGKYPRQMQRLARELGLERVSFTGELSSSNKTSAFFAADLFVLPTLSENFGVVIAEALAHGVPVITTHAAPWSGLAAHACGWSIPVGMEPLIEALREALSKPKQELQDMGARGRAWMQRDFSWPTIGRMMLHSYEWLLHRGDRPDWIVFD